MHVHRLHAGDGVAHHVDQTCLRNDLCHPFGDAAVDVGPPVARRALSDRSGPAGAVEQRLVPAAAAGPVVLGYEEVRLAEHPAVSNEDVGMLIEVVTKTHGPGLHRPDHHKSRQGHRVVTAIDVFRSPSETAPGTHSLPGRPGPRKEYFPAPGGHAQPREPTAAPRGQRDQHDSPSQPASPALGDGSLSKIIPRLGCRCSESGG